MNDRAFLLSFFVTFVLVQPLEYKLSGNPWNTKKLCFLCALMLSRKRICTSIWAKHVAQQLIMSLEKQQCMPVIAQFMLLKIDIPQLDKLAIFIQRCFLCSENFALLFFQRCCAYFCSAKCLIFHRCKIFVTGLVNVVSIKENANGNENRQCYYLCGVQ